MKILLNHFKKGIINRGAFTKIRIITTARKLDGMPTTIKKRVRRKDEIENSLPERKKKYQNTCIIQHYKRFIIWQQHNVS